MVGGLDSPRIRFSNHPAAPRAGIYIEGREMEYAYQFDLHFSDRSVDVVQPLPRPWPWSNSVPENYLYHVFDHPTRFPENVL